MMTALVSDFRDRGVEKIPNLISPELAKFCSDLLFLRFNAYKILKPLGTVERNYNVYERLYDYQTDNVWPEYCPDIGDTLLTFVQPKVEEVVGEKLLPGYSYSRIYFSGSGLKPHTDRLSCEISVTLNLSFTGEVWPIYFKSNDRHTTYEVMLNEGDGAVYRGSELVHWREELKDNNTTVQVFLHYVKAEGQFTDCKYDGRRALGLNHEKGVISGLTNGNQLYRSDISKDRLIELGIVDPDTFNHG